jgi:hypothetical protein
VLTVRDAGRRVGRLRIKGLMLTDNASRLTITGTLHGHRLALAIPAT